MMTDMLTPKGKIDQLSGRLRPWLPALGALTFGVALLVYAYLGFFSRYYADDYCLTGGFLSSGFWQSQVGLYTSWSPRFSGTFLLNLSEFFGRGSIRIWSALVIVLWAAALAWTVLQAARLARLRVPLGLGLLLAEALVFFTILEAPQQYQSVYWRVGAITYTLPLVFLSFLAGLICNRIARASTGRLPWGAASACALLALVAGGFSETYVTLQTAVLALALIAAWPGAKSPQRRTGRLLVGAALAGSLLALLVVVLAPGNAVRLAAMPGRPAFFALVRMAVTSAFLFIYMSLKNNAFQNVLTLLVPLLINYWLYAVSKDLPKMRPSALSLGLFLTPLAGALLVLAVCTPSAYAESSYPDGRVLIEAAFILVATLGAEGLLIGMSLSQLHLWAQEPAPLFLQLLSAVLFLVTVLYPLYDARKTVAQVPVYLAHAATWDSQAAFVSAEIQKGIQNVNLQDGQARSFDPLSGLEELSSDPKNWVNQCAAGFYGLHSLTVNAP
jgi:hypothetical protein